MTPGEGQFNSRHGFPSSTRQGIGRFEPDPPWWGMEGSASPVVAGEPSA
ncbi:MAG: hypothetical protein ACLP62_06170 [Acidimicrobiales bacterium]